MLSVNSKPHDESSVLSPQVNLRSCDGSRQRVRITCVPQTKIKRPSESTKKEEEREKEESMFVTLLIFHTLQIDVYCIGVGWVVRAVGYRMSGYNVVVGGNNGCLL